MSWSSSTIWWHVYPLGFVGAEPTAVGEVHHRLGRLVDWLDHLVELGANGLLLGPVFASQSHGYDTLDHFRVDPRLGDDADLDALITAAHDRGVRVLLDGVFNHVDEHHEIVRGARAAGPDSSDGAWIRWVDGYPRGFEGSLNLVELDLDHPPVQDHVVSVMTHWLDRGIDGWRLDAAYAAGADAWRPVVDRVRSAHPDCWLLAEVIHGDYADFVTRSGVDSITQYELWKAVWSSINDHNLHELAWTLGRHRELLETVVPQVFVGNHDTTRIATRIEDPRLLGAASALGLLLPGVPSVYAGDEEGFTGEKTDGPHGDDAVRPPFPAHPQELSTLGADRYAEHRHLIHLRRTRPWLTDARPEVRHVENEVIVVDLTARTGEERASLVINLGDDAVEVDTAVGTRTVDPLGWSLED